MSKIHSISIKVEALNGADPAQICREMVSLAQKLDILVETDINGVYLAALPETLSWELMEEWNQRMARKL